MEAVIDHVRDRIDGHEEDRALGRWRGIAPETSGGEKAGVLKEVLTHALFYGVTQSALRFQAIEQRCALIEFFKAAVAFPGVIDRVNGHAPVLANGFEEMRMAVAAEALP